MMDAEMPIPTLAKPPSGQGHIKALQGDALQYLEYAATQGDFLKLPIPLNPIYLINHPELVQDVLVRKSRSFHKPFSVKYTANQIFGDNLFTSDGELWKILRSSIQPSFSVSHLQEYGQSMVKDTQKMLTHWNNGAQLEITQEMMALTLRTTTRCFFGLDLENTDRGNDLLQFIEVFFQRITSIPVPGWVPIPSNQKLKQLANKNRQFCAELIAERRQSKDEHGDILSILIKAQKYDQTGILTDIQIANEVSNLFAAGYEVTAYSLAFTLYLLATHPPIEAKLRQELEEQVGDRDFSVTDLDHLPFLESVVKESMRLIPVTAMVGRQTVENVEIQGQKLPKKSMVLIAPWILHRREDIFPEPLTFKPERFQGDVTIPKFSYLPFSGGPRACIGQGFAMMQIRINLAMILQKYRLRLCPNYIFKPIFKFNTRPQNGLPMILDSL